MRWTWMILAVLLTPLAAAEVHEVRTVRTGDDAAPFAFEPATLTIQVGDTVRWVNDDGVFHTTTSRARDGGSNGDDWTGTLGSKGVTFEHTFDEAGTFAYFCQPHASFMEGTITVEASGSKIDEKSPGLPLMGLLLALFVAARLR